jgi:hypothetical protein
MNMNTNDFRSQAMLVGLSISYWTGKASDESVVDGIVRSSKSERNQHEYRKILVKPDAINAVKAVRSRARAYHFEKTLPWIDGGTRVLPSAFYMDYAAKMREFRNEYEQETRKFCNAYTALKGEARKRLGSLYREEDYPSASALLSKFSWDMGVFPIPSKDDWRVDSLGGQANSEIKKQIEEKVQAAMQVATKDLWKRLHDVVKALAEKMKEGGEGVFRDSIIGNIKELCGVMDAMNVAGDAELAKMTKAIQASLAKLDPAELRDDKKKRKQAADTADDILKKMAAYIGK